MADTNLNLTPGLARLGLAADYIAVECPAAPWRAPVSRHWNDAAGDTIRFAVLLLADVAAVILAATAAVFGTHLASYLGLEPRSLAIGSDKLATAASDFGFVAIGAVAYLISQGRYRARQPLWSEMRQAVMVGCGALFVSCLEQFAVRGHASRQLLIGTWLLFPAFATLLRLAAKTGLNKAGLWQMNVVVLGEPSALRYASARLSANPLLGYRIVNALTPQQLGLGSVGNRYRRLLEAHGARHLILAIDFGSLAGRQLVEEVVRERVPFSLIFQAHGIPVSGYEPVSFFSDSTILLSHRNNLNSSLAKCVKAAFDIALSVPLLLLLAVPMLLIALLIRLDGGPALFSHARIGARGRVFRCLKFRTMVPDAETVLTDLLVRDAQARSEWTTSRKLACDPRVTRVGRFLRATSLDELPQLINIVRLDMSLVGPRPIVHAEVARYGEDFVYYCETRPGLTGLWQVSGRSDTTYERRVELDRWYVHNWTLWHDIAILLKTVPAVIFQHGAR
jgi:undecaprenyl-phosphate galactose phosphotransferase